MDRVTSAILLAALCFPRFSSGLSTYYMKEHCGQTLSLKAERTHSLSLVLTSEPTYDANMNCYVIVRAKPGHRIMTSFEWLNVSSFRHCPGDFLEILDCQHTRNRSSSTCITLSRICGHRKPDVIFVSHNDSVTLRFVSDGQFFGKGFQIVLTQFHDGGCREDGEFLCDNGRCVHADLGCSSWTRDSSPPFDHCGDGSSRCRLPPLVIACIVVGSVVFVIVALLVSVLVWYRVRGVKEEEEEDGACDEDLDGVRNQAYVVEETASQPPQQETSSSAPPTGGEDHQSGSL